VNAAAIDGGISTVMAERCVLHVHEIDTPTLSPKCQQPSHQSLKNPLIGSDALQQRHPGCRLPQLPDLPTNAKIVIDRAPDERLVRGSGSTICVWIVSNSCSPSRILPITSACPSPPSTHGVIGDWVRRGSVSGSM